MIKKCFPFGQKSSYIQSHLWLMSWFWFKSLLVLLPKHSLTLFSSISNPTSADHHCLLPWRYRNILPSLFSQFPLLSHSSILQRATRVAFYKYKLSHFYHMFQWLSTAWRISKPLVCDVAPGQMAACTLGHSHSALQDARLLSQVSMHWFIPLELCSVTSP